MANVGPERRCRCWGWSQWPLSGWGRPTWRHYGGRQGVILAVDFAANMAAEKGPSWRPLLYRQVIGLSKFRSTIVGEARIVVLLM
jgi:hypothetical protein